MLCAVLLLTACASHPRAPVEERSAYRSTTVTRPAEYRVAAGDTVYGIAFRYGMDWRDLARRNGLVSPYIIFPGQVLRLNPKTTTTAATTSRWQSTAPAADRGGTPPAAKSAPRQTAKTTSSPPASSAKPNQRPAANGSSTAKPQAAQVKPAPQAAAPGGLVWRWPVEGRILSTFRPGDQSRLGLDIAGRPGEPVRAAASGQVVYSGSGLIGYGELIIVKHDDRLLSAYGHNRKRLVQEGDLVSAGQTISELGHTPDGQAALHFEIRLDGQPQDPERYLPRR